MFKYSIEGEFLCCSKISVKEVHAIKSKAFTAALSFKALKESGGSMHIKRQSGNVEFILKKVGYTLCVISAFGKAPQSLINIINTCTSCYLFGDYHEATCGQKAAL